MALAAGTRLGAYEITALVGAGGMGEVYRARDTKLNRDVALKILPELFAADPERLARFKREAQLLASLNHPNIAAIYGLEEAADVASGLSRTALVYAPGKHQELSTRPVWVDHAGREIGIDVPRGLYLGPRISPDGRQIALNRIGSNGLGEIWVLDVESGRMFPVAMQGANYNPTWRPDVQGRLTFTSNGDLFETPVGDQSAPVRLLSRDNYQWPVSWSPDGRLLVFMEISSAGIHLWSMPREGQPARLIGSPSNAGGARFSPDGNWLAYVSDETGQQEVYVRRYAGTERGQQVSRNGGREPVWSGDGRTLFYRDGDRMLAVAMTTQPVFRSDTPVELWTAPYFTHGLFGTHNYDVAADGRFLMLRLSDESAATSTRINVVLHWLDELQQRGVVQ